MWCKALLGPLVLLIAGCGTATHAAVVARPSTAVASPSEPPTPSAVPGPKAPAPANIAVQFSGLPAGTFPTHVHSVCSGSQNFHVTVVQSLVIRGGTGTIQVPRGYFGRGLCLIVYSSPSLSRVLTTKRV